MAPNERVIKAYEKYPDIFIPFGFIDLGLDTPALVAELFNAGFKGVKFTRARKNYDDKSFYQNVGDQSHPFDRIVFGTDVPIPEMEQAKRDYQNIMDDLEIPEPVRKRVWRQYRPHAQWIYGGPYRIGF